MQLQASVGGTHRDPGAHRVSAGGRAGEERLPYDVAEVDVLERADLHSGDCFFVHDDRRPGGFHPALYWDERKEGERRLAVSS